MPDCRSCLIGTVRAPLAAIRLVTISRHLRYGELKRALNLEGKPGKEEGAAEDGGAQYGAPSPRYAARGPKRGGLIRAPLVEGAELGVFELRAEEGARIVLGGVRCDGSGFFTARVATLHSSGEPSATAAETLSLRLTLVRSMTAEMSTDGP